MPSFEKLASFYLGRRWNADAEAPEEEPLLYDAKDLTTHAVCIGMTGSGKTGLGITLLEEAALDGIPALVIDPKGDMGNLLLTFPELAAEDFRPWVDPGAAAREGMEPDAYAAKIAKRWREGLAAWDQDGARIRRLRDAVDVALYTPGSTSGLQLTVLRSFEAPPPEVLGDAELLGDRLEGAALGLLALAGIEADPLQSREFVLVSSLLRALWREGQSPTLVDLLQGIQRPPFERLGVFDLESFYPAKERLALAMRLNNLVASPGFATWLQGDPLDVGRLLHTTDGRPRVSILSIAHLSDAERMFFVTCVLHEVLAWMRRQAGTSSLRAILYMDEIFGFFPPTAAPPSKKPMLTLLKQARAYGLGVVLATQNPVDLDYKGLSNIGTWFLGRLQTEQDKRRVLDGLESASDGGSGLDRGELSDLLSSLDSRVFLLSNVHEDGPVLFHTRWAMSYLRGPLTREQVSSLTGARRAAEADEVATVRASTAPAAAAAAALPPPAAARPVLAAAIVERFLAQTEDVPVESLLYRPALLAACRLHWVDGRRGIDAWRDETIVLALDEEASVDWDECWRPADADAMRLEKEPEPEATLAPLPAVAARAQRYRSWRTSLKSWLYANRRAMLWKNAATKLTSRFDESEGDFRVRVGESFRERRDLELEKLRGRYAKKFAVLRDRTRRAEERIGREKDQLSQKKRDSLLSAGTNLLGALFGRKVASRTNVSRLGSSARSISRISKEKGDVERAEAELAAQQEKLAELEQELEQEIDVLEDRWHPSRIELEPKPLAPRKADLEVPEPTLLWLPWRRGADGGASPAFPTE